MTASLASMTGFARAEGSCGGPLLGLGTAQRQRPRPRSALPTSVWLGRAGARRCARPPARLLKRGNVTANLSVKRESEPRLVADPAALEQALTLAMELHSRIPGSPVPRAEALLGLPGVLRPAQTEEVAQDTDAVAAGFSRALAALVDGASGRGHAACARRSQVCWTRSLHCTARQLPKQPISPRRSAPG